MECTTSTKYHGHNYEDVEFQRIGAVGPNNTGKSDPSSLYSLLRIGIDALINRQKTFTHRQDSINNGIFGVIKLFSTCSL